MRRAEFESTNRLDALTILEQAHVGHLGIVREGGIPRVVPLNFTFLDGRIYFHGASEGEKYNAILKNPTVAFSADLPYSMIPSYWVSPNMACPATQFFKAVHITGHCELVGDTAEKARAFNKMMKKYQPEGHYEPLDPHNPIYTAMLQKSAVYRIRIEQMTVKEKFGQNLSPASREELIQKLQQRGLPIDRHTAAEIKKTLE